MLPVAQHKAPIPRCVPPMVSDQQADCRIEAVLIGLPGQQVAILLHCPSFECGQPGCRRPPSQAAADQVPVGLQKAPALGRVVFHRLLPGPDLRQQRRQRQCREHLDPEPPLRRDPAEIRVLDQLQAGQEAPDRCRVAEHRRPGTAATARLHATSKPADDAGRDPLHRPASGQVRHDRRLVDRHQQQPVRRGQRPNEVFRLVEMRQTWRVERRLPILDHQAGDRTRISWIVGPGRVEPDQDLPAQSRHNASSSRRSPGGSSSPVVGLPSRSAGVSASVR